VIEQILPPATSGNIDQFVAKFFRTNSGFWVDAEGA
jgi:hypothetical protein